MVTKLVGLRIAELRHERDLSQLELSNRIGMARTYFAEVETGKRNVSIRNLEKIVSGLGITLAEFFDSDIFDSLYESSPTPNIHYEKCVINYACVTLPPLE